MIANIAIAGGFIVSSVLIALNIISIRRMRRTYAADLFFKIAGNIDAVVKEQFERQSQGRDAVEQWYQRLLNVLEDFGYFANRKLLSKKMIEHYIPTLLKYCDYAGTYSASLRKTLAERGAEELSEIRKIYEKRTRKKLPF